MTTDPSTLPSGQPFGRYLIRRLLGSGAFGAVYEAVQQPLGKRVALKVLHASQVHEAEAVRRFQAEAEATAQLRHQHIVDVVDLGEEGGRPFIAMEFLEGETLGARIERERRLPARVAIDLLIPVLSAVAAVHDAGIVHRDLKPDNIFLATVRLGKTDAKLLDFGVAKMREARHSLTRTGSMVGTVYYMSPEQARESKDVDGRSDQWALAVILYECLTGRMAFPGEALIEILTGIIGAPVPAMSDVDLPVGLEPILRRAMQKNRDDRYESVRAFGAALLAFASASVRSDWSAEFGQRSDEVREPVASRDPAPSPLLESLSVRPREIPALERSAVGAAAPSALTRRRTIFLTAVSCAAIMVTVAAGYEAMSDRSPAPLPRTVVRRPSPREETVDASVQVTRIEVDSSVVAAQPATPATSPAHRDPPVARARPRAVSNGLTSTGIEIH